MKVLYLPIGSQPGTVNAFSKFAETKVLDFMTSPDPEGEFLCITQEFKPDLVHMQLQMTDKIKPATIRKARAHLPKAVFTNWTGDIRKQPCKNFINTSKVVDFALMSNVGQIDLYRKNGCSNPTYWQIGYDPKLYFPKNKKQFKYDVSFIGNSYNRMFPDSKMRTAIAESVKRKFGDRAGIFGGAYNKKLKIGTCKMTDSNDIYNDSVCVLSISNFNDVGHYFSDRMLMCLASGRPTIAWRFPGSESYFAERGDFLVARSEQDVFNLIQECKDNPEWANNIGRNGHLKVLAEHTFDSRVLELFAITGLSSML